MRKGEKSCYMYCEEGGDWEMEVGKGREEEEGRGGR
jgi:hypothetical protein